MAAHDPLTVEARDTRTLWSPAHDALSRYVEVCWLPVLGPSALLALRRLREGTLNGPVVVDLAALAATLGLSRKTHAGSPVARTLSRLVQYHAASIRGDVYRIHTHLPANRRLTPGGGTT